MPLMTLLISDTIASLAQAGFSGLVPDSLRRGFVGHSCTRRLVLISYWGETERTLVPGSSVSPVAMAFAAELTP
jgi:hypothetical protein